jgi:hypothetical protein
MAQAKDETKISAQETERNVQDQPAPDAPQQDRAKLDPLKTGRTAQLMAEDAADLRSQTSRTQSQRKSKKNADVDVDPIPDAPIPSRTERGPAQPRQTAKPSNSFGRFITTVIVLIVVIAGLFGTMPWWYGRMPMLVQGWVPEQLRPPSSQVSASVTQDIMALQQRLATTETEIAALQRTVQSTPATVPLDTSATDSIIADLQQRLRNIETQANVTPTETIGANISAESVTALSNAVTTQAQQLATVTARIATVEAALGNATTLEDVSTRVARLEDRSADAATVLTLAARITQVEAAASTLVNEQSSAIGLLLSVSQLQDAVSNGRPYGLELETVNAFAAKAERVAFETTALTAHQNSGVATRAEIKDRFDRIAPAVVRADLLPTNSASWIQRAVDQVLSLVNVRRLEDDGSATVGAVINRIQSALDEGDFLAAVATAEELSGLSGDTLAPWLKDAQVLVAAETAVRDLTTKAIAHMNSGRDITTPRAQTEN